MKKVIIALLACVTLFAACKKEPVPVKVQSIKLDQTAASVVEGSTVKIEATVNPSDADNKTLSWASDNSAVATVDNGGTVTGVKAGTAKITASATDGSGVSASCTVTVTEKAIPVEKVEFELADKTLNIGETFENKVTITPENATNKSLKFETSDAKIASVDDKGVITAVAAGEATIKVTSVDNASASASCKITVKPEPKSIFLKFKKAVMRVGGKAMNQQAWYGTPEAYADREDVVSPTWETGNAAVVSNEAAKFTAVAPGETVITVTDADGNKVECPVTVLAPTVKPADYQHGVAIGNLSDNSGWLQKVNGTKVNVDLGEGYVAGTQKITINVANYKAVEKTWDASIDASAYNDKNPALFIRLFIDDITKFNFDGQGGLGLSSDGTTDNELLRIPWTVIFSNATGADSRAKQAVHNGWNNVVIPLDAVAAVDPAWNKINLKRINNFRLYQNPSAAVTGAKLVIDQLRIVDWTEFDNCDNFDMWFDRMTDNNLFLCSLDEADKKEGKGSFAVTDHIIAGPTSNYRLEMWPGLETALPINMDESNSGLEFWLYVSDGDAFKSGMHCVFELSSELINDQHNYSWAKVPGDISFQTGWNKITLKFSEAAGDVSATSKRDIRKFNYFRAVFTPQGAPAKPYTYKIDDIRFVKL